MVKVGDKVVRVPKTFQVLARPNSVELITKPMKGEVIFVHSQHRFHTVEFTNAFGGKTKDTYDGVD